MPSASIGIGITAICQHDIGGGNNDGEDQGQSRCLELHGDDKVLLCEERVVVVLFSMEDKLLERQSG